MRLFSRGSSSTSTKPWIKNFTDITGYTGVQDGLDYSHGETLFYNISYGSFTTHTSIAPGNYCDWSYIKTYTSNGFYILGGQRIENEPDYTLGNVPTGLKVGMMTTSGSSLDVYNYLIKGNLNNSNSTETITIDEIALFFHIHHSSSYTAWHGQYSDGDFLLIKEYLETPVTLEPGDDIAISFNLFGDE